MGNSGQDIYNPGRIDISAKVLDQEIMKNQTLGDVLRFWMLKENTKQDQLAEACGVSQAHISLLVSNKKNPSVTLLSKITDFFHTDLADFFRQPSCTLEDFTLVPKLSAKPIGGEGGLETDANFVGWYSFKREFLERKGKPSAMYLFEIKGDSMENTLKEGDMILVDTSQNEPITGKIYLVRLNSDLMVKRIEKRSGGIRLISDNDMYEHIDIKNGGVDDVEIHGRMVWSCREY